jgi:hypothetical protein
MKAESSWSNHFPRTPSLNSAALGTELSTREPLENISDLSHVCRGECVGYLEIQSTGIGAAEKKFLKFLASMPILFLDFSTCQFTWLSSNDFLVLWLI